MEEMDTAYTQDELYFSEFKKYISAAYEDRNTHWVAKYPIIGIAADYYPSLETKISKTSFK
jgi:hypothetical protein